jgi:lysophospholipase
MLNAMGLGKISSGPQKKIPYVNARTVQNNSLTSDRKQLERLQKIVSLDPRLSIGPPSFSWLAAAIKEIKSLKNEKKLNIPSIVLIGSGDTIVSQEAAKAQLSDDPKSVFKIYNEARHELLIETDTITKLVWQNIEAFLTSLEK